MVKIRWFSYLVLFALGGCAIHSGVVTVEPGLYLVSRQAATGFTGMGKLKAEAFREASRFCEGQGKTVQVLTTQESEPPYIFGNFPRVEVEFTCVEG